ncbi:MAG: transposase [Acetobacteraceae bacterium]|nr:transposase [Acetobacteraceae bacterium]
MSAGQDEIAAAMPRGRGRRRSWSRAEKSRIVDEAFRPGASAADVARSYGLNANQVFNWRRALAAPAKTKGRGAAPKASAKALTAPSNGFLPVGITVPTSDDGLAPVSVAGVAQLDQRATRYPPGERTGLIEIDLICGTRLRVDAFVDERALRRVLSAVKASS